MFVFFFFSSRRRHTRSLRDWSSDVYSSDLQNDDKQRHKEERFKTLSERAAELGLPAVAVTDLNNLFGMVKFYKSAEGAGVKPIIGADLTLEERKAGEGAEQFTLLVQNERGYRNL